MTASLTRMLPISSLVAGKNARGPGFDVSDLIDSLNHGPMLQNICVRRVQGAREQYEVIAGHRRVEAARKKGLRHIEAKIFEDVGDLLAEQLGLEENIRRRALDNEPKAIARLVELYELTSPTLRGGDRKSENFKLGPHGLRDRLMSSATRVARAMGKSPREVRRKARIGRLGTDKLQRAVMEKVVTLVEGERLAGLTAREQDRQVGLLRHRRSEPAPEIRRLIESLVYAEKMLSGPLRNTIDLSAIYELRARSRAIAKMVNNLKPARGGKRVPTTKAAKVSRAAVTTSGKTRAPNASHFTPRSCNGKLAQVGLVPTETRPRPVAIAPFVAATSSSIQATCPESCVFKSGGSPGSVGGCYADAGFTRIKVRKLDEAAKGYTSIEVVREQVRQIDAAFRGGRIPQDGARGGRDLRVNVFGDVLAAAEAELLGGAATRWKARGGGAVWTFTHSWKIVPRSAWGPDISVLASVENPRDILIAKAQGYATAVVVPEFRAGDKAYRLPEARKTRIIPCPAETRGTNCAACRLCLSPDSLFRADSAIAFKIHGQHAASAIAAVEQACEQ